MKLGQIKGNENLRRDLKTNAVLNVDEQAYQTYINMRCNAVKVKMLESEIEEMKKLIAQILESKNG